MTVNEESRWPGFTFADPQRRLDELAAELSAARRAGFRVGRHGGPAPVRTPVHDPPGPYDGRHGRALADIRRIGKERW